MTEVANARSIATEWIERHRRQVPGFAGALLHGSIATLPLDAPLPAGADIDILVITSQPADVVPRGKLEFGGVLLDITPLSLELVVSPAQVLENYRLAGSFRVDGILADSSGHLRALHRDVAVKFAQEPWVRSRMSNADRNVDHHLSNFDPATPLPSQAIAVLFGTGVLTHILLVAGLKNPTIRRRYVTTEQLLDSYGFHESHEQLLALLGSQSLSSADVWFHLATMTEAFDFASTLDHSSFFFGSDLSHHARPIAIDGSRAMIESGYHREAMFWIAVTWCRVMQVFEFHRHHATRSFESEFLAMLDDLGIASSAAIANRISATRQARASILELAETVISNNPEIIHTQDDTGYTRGR